MRFRLHLPLIIGLLLAATVLAGCGRVQRAGQLVDGNEFDLTLAVEPAPPAVGDAVLIITLRDAAAAPISDATISVEANMAHAGMTPEFGEVRGGEDGRYQVPIRWTMGGDWTVDVTAVLPDGRTAVQQFPVTVAGNS